MVDLKIGTVAIAPGDDTMPTKTWIKAALGLSAAMLGVLCCSSPTVASDIPLGFQVMCLKTPSECTGGGASVATGSDALLSTLERINSQVNRSITPRKDRGADVWSVDVSVGDCEDFALTKRRALINAGLPASSLRLAYVKTRRGEGHAILVVKTTRGDFVLDNLNASVRPLSQSGYRIVSTSGADPMAWS
jgi:predicted transglutaminase-like cysteine proteinase